MKLDKTNIRVGQGTQQPEATEEAPLEKSSTGDVTPTNVVSDVPHQLFGQVANAGVKQADGGVSLGELLRDPGVPGAPPDGLQAFQRALADTDVFVFDMDNTLVDTRPRHVEALRVLLERGRDLTSADVEALRGVTIDQIRYRPEDTAAAVGLSEEATTQYVKLWEDVFWSPDLARTVDRKMAHVVELAERAHKAGKKVRCLTARTREHWGDSPWEHLKEMGLDFLQREDVFLKRPDEDTVEFIAGMAADGSSVVLVTDSSEEIQGLQKVAQGSVGRIRGIQVEFPYVPSEASISPDTPLIAFDSPIMTPTILPKDVGVIVGRDGKLGELLSSKEAAALREKQNNFGSGIRRILDNALVLDSPRQLPLAAPSLSPERHARIAVGGFFRPPDTTDHHSVVRGFLDALVTELGDENVAFMTSATTSSGTLERLVTEVSDAWEVPTVYFTANAYLGKADAEKLPAALRPHYQAATKVVLPEKDLYGWAEMATSTALVTTGGQRAAVSDFVKAIQLGNPVVFVINSDLGPLTFDRESGKPSNGAAYVTAMLQARAEIVTAGLADGRSGEQIAAEVCDPANYPYPFMPHRNFDGDFLVDYGRDVTNLVVSFEVDGASDLGPSAKAAAQHLRRRLGIKS